jgi:phage shock protein PspC (stress-responsive transcriptional regulator)
MSLESRIEHFFQTLEGGLEGKKGPGNQQEALMLRQINEVVEFAQRLQEDELRQNQKSRNRLLLMAAGLAMAAGLLALSWLAPNPDRLVGWSVFFGLVSGLFGAGYLSRQLNRNPAGTLQGRLDKLWRNLRAGFPRLGSASKDAKDASKTANRGNLVDGGKLYKSRTNQIVAGVCGGLAEYFGLPVGLLRLVALVSIFVTGGTSLVGYIIGAAVLRYSPRHGEV